MNRSESIIELSQALASFHSLVGRIGKDSKNPFFKSNYASLPHILSEIQEPLEKSGLVITQFPDGDGLTTMLIHAKTGQFLEATYTMPVAKANDPQALGSAISYARRYAVSSILSLKIDDDDAEKAMKSVRSTQYQKDVQAFEKPALPWLNENTTDWKKVVGALKTGYTIAQVKTRFRLSKENEQKLIEQAK